MRVACTVGHMRRALPLLAVSALVAVGASVLSIRPSGAGEFSGYVPPATSVAVIAPDGGLPVTLSVPDGGVPVTLGAAEVPVNVLSSVRLDVSATAPSGTFLPVAGDTSGARLEVAIPAGVAVTNTPNVNVANVPTVGLANGTQVSLTSASLNAITTATGKGSCTYVEGGQLATLGNTATNIPASPMASRTAITITNTSTVANKRVVCAPGATASTTVGKPIYSGGGVAKWEGAQAGWVLSCICIDNGSVSTGCTYQVEEERCYQ